MYLLVLYKINNLCHASARISGKVSWNGSKRPKILQMRKSKRDTSRVKSRLMRKTEIRNCKLLFLTLDVTFSYFYFTWRLLSRKADTWPPKLIMQLMPKQLIGSIGGTYLKNSKSVVFHPTPCEALESLTKMMTAGFVSVLCSTLNTCFLFCLHE